VDVEGTSDVSQGECIVLSKSPDGVNKIIAMDDQLVWTASGSSSVARWKAPLRRNARLQVYNNPPLDLSPNPSLGAPGLTGRGKHSNSIDTFATARTYTPPPGPHVSAPSIHGSVVDTDGEDTLCGIPYKSMVKLISANETFTPYVQHGRDPEIATLYSAASVMSVPRLDGRPHMPSVLQHARSFGNTSPVRSETLIGSAENTPAVYPMNSARNEYEDREVASEAEPLLDAPDYVIQGDKGLVRSIILNNRMHALTVDTAGEVAVWDVIRAICLGKFVKDDVSAASHSDSGSTSSDDSDKNPSPREALETVRERIEGQAVVNPWSSVDTKMGLLTVHLTDRCFEAEIYADEAGYGPEKNFGDELRCKCPRVRWIRLPLRLRTVNIARWLLRNLFLGFVREQQRIIFPRRSKDSGSPQEYTPPHRGVHRGVPPTHIDINSSMRRRRSSSDTSRKSHSSSTMVVSSPSMIPAVPPLIAGAKGASPLLAPMIPLHGVLTDSTLSTIPQSPQIHSGSNVTTPMPSKLQNTPAPGTPREGSDYFNHRFRSGSVSATTPGDDSKTPSQDTISGGSGSGLIGRLRNLGKSSSRRAPSDILISSTTIAAGSEPTKDSGVEVSLLDTVAHHTLTPPRNRMPR
jgi:WD repeat-containing protein 48